MLKITNILYKISIFLNNKNLATFIISSQESAGRKAADVKYPLLRDEKMVGLMINAENR